MSLSSRRLRRADAIKTGGIIRPVGIAEVDGAVGEAEALQWNPGGVGQVCGGLDHERDFRCPGDVEPESGWPDVAALHQRIPQSGWATVKGRAPVGGVGEVKDGRVVITSERFGTEARSVSFEKGTYQAGAVIKRSVPDAYYAAGDRDVKQVGAIRERIISDVCDCAGDRDARQAGAGLERIVADARDAARDGDAGQAGAVGERINT